MIYCKKYLSLNLFLTDFCFAVNDNMATLNVSILKSKSNDQNAKEQYITVDIDHDVKLPEGESYLYMTKLSHSKITCVFII